MLLKELFLFQFKNFKECQINSFSPKVNAIIGPNGSGKTNLLDAIYMLCFTKSAFNSIDSQLINHGNRYFMITAKFQSITDSSLVVNIGYQEGQKKTIQLNKKAYKRLSDHIGKFPAVLISPYDQEIIHLGSEVRRKFFDAMISQYDTHYLNHLLKYNRALKHRNNLLSQFNEQNYFDDILIEPFNIQLKESGEYIFHKRSSFLADFEKYFKVWMATITNESVNVKINYLASINVESLSHHLLSNVRLDITAKRTTKGIHKDDYQFLLDGIYPLKKFGSQGQQKSCIMAMKLAQYDLLKAKTKKFPLLLLDDILDKLDDSKIKALTSLISSDNVGQVFVTDANESRVKSLFSTIEDINYINIFNGEHLEN